jgi:glycopeptide antibiotics resistance protein
LSPTASTSTLGAAPPPAGRSRYPLAAGWGLALTLLFIAYQTTLPFDFQFSRAQLAFGWERATLIPFTSVEGYPASRSDIIGNVLLFLPLGYFLALSPLGARRGAWRPLLLTGIGCALSLCVESAQLFSPLRYAQTTDLITNTLGTWTGIVAAMTFGADIWDRSLDWLLLKLRLEPAAPMVVGLTAAVLLGALLPLDLNISRASIRTHLRAAQLGLFDFPAASSPLLLVISMIKQAWLMAFWGAAAASWLASHRRRLLLTVGWGGLLAFAAEGSQLFVVSRTLSVTEPIVAWCGAMLGSVAVLWGRDRGWSLRTLLIALGAGYAIYLACDSLSPLAPAIYDALRDGRWPEANHLAFSWIPLENREGLPKLVALGDWLARWVRFAPLGLALPLLVGRPAARWAVAGGAGAAVLLMEVIAGRFSLWYGGEISQAMMAWLGIAAGWWAGRRIAAYRSAGAG